MKKLWWVAVGVFLVGIGVGAQLIWKPQQTAPPSFQEGALLPQLSDTRPPATEPTIQQVGFEDGGAILPSKLQYTTLVAQELVSYDGADLENGSAETVFDVAALVLSNTGTIGIEYAQVELVQDGNRLYFGATFIPPRSTVLILEENMSPYSDSPVTQCNCRTAIPGNFDWSEKKLTVKEMGLSGLQVTNLTDRTVNCVRVFYKHHYGKDDLYVGGITYSAVIPYLAPGETRTVNPYRYAAGYTKIVAITTE